MFGLDGPVARWRTKKRLVAQRLGDRPTAYDAHDPKIVLKSTFKEVAEHGLDPNSVDVVYLYERKPLR